MVQTIEPVIVVRRVRVPREFAFRAWTEPERLRKWLPAKGETCEVRAHDLRPGGKYELLMGAYTLLGEFVEITTPEKLSFTWQRVGEGADHASSLVTVTFTAIEGGTEISIRHELLTSEEAAEKAFQLWMERLTRFSSDASMSYMMEEFTMTTTLENPTGWGARIEAEKALFERAMNRLYDTFNHVPDDKLGYQVSDTTKSPIRLAAHIGLSNAFFAQVLTAGTVPDNEQLKEVLSTGEAKELEYTSREQVMELLEQTQDAVNKAYDVVSHEALEANPRLQFFSTLPAYHVVNHACQIDYIQTIWGDLENHFGM